MTPWREHARLQGRFHPDFPDDLQVIAHDGHPAVSGHNAELIWVRVTGADGAVFKGIALNKPIQLVTVAEGAEILFIVPEGGAYPLQVTNEYLTQRDSWRLLMPCQKCGLTELLSPAGELVASSFPQLAQDAPRKGFNFTTQCGWCGGAQVVRMKRARAKE